MADGAKKKTKAQVPAKDPQAESVAGKRKRKLSKKEVGEEQKQEEEEAKSTDQGHRRQKERGREEKVKKKRKVQPEESKPADTEPAKKKAKKKDMSAESKRSRIMAAKKTKLEEQQLRYKQLSTECQEYLSKWKHNRSEWKFQKARQIWILKHVYKPQHVPDELFGLAIEYLESIKGGARKLAKQYAKDHIKSAEKLIKKAESLEEEDMGVEEDGEGKKDETGKERNSKSKVKPEKITEEQVENAKISLKRARILYDKFKDESDAE
ncbi:hypothetical protein EV182_005744 [Spiromyces aspiralis]|uniref:Uncharacterized protein n=1 Tax=Spiromyces aspiralis TaxID=68401 RepID=A0ACC1HMC7_9FUNG|nr:hypothetical protein EV182_005744 [Spiromyces aspiralis]